MKIPFFSPKASRADIEREAQQELEAAMNRAQPPTDAQRTWVLPLQDLPTFRQAPAPAPRPARRRTGLPLIPPPGAAPRAPAAPSRDDFDDVPFGDDDTPLDQVPLEEVFGAKPPRPAAAPPRPAAPRPAAPRAAASRKAAAPVRKRPPTAKNTGAEEPRPRAPQKRTPPTRRRPPG